MVARTLIDTTCDFCAVEGKTTKGETVTIGGVKFDACSKHRKARLAEFEALVERFGRPADELSSTISAATKQDRQAAKRQSTGSVVTRVGRAADLRCGDCDSLLMKASKYWHASKVHSKSARDIKWTAVTK